MVASPFERSASKRKEKRNHQTASWRERPFSAPSWDTKNSTSRDSGGQKKTNGFSNGLRGQIAKLPRITPTPQPKQGGNQGGKQGGKQGGQQGGKTATPATPTTPAVVPGTKKIGPYTIVPGNPYGNNPTPQQIAEWKAQNAPKPAPTPQQQQQGKAQTQFATDIQSQLRDFTSGLGGLNYWDGTLGDRWGQLNQISNDFWGYTGPDYKGFMNEGAGAGIKTQLKDLNARLAGLSGQKKAEQARISDYEQGLLSFSDEIGSGLQDLTIADIDQITALDRQLDQRMREAGRFSSQLDFDFNDELGELYGYDWQIDDLLAQRSSEENRIASARDNFTTGARNILDMVEDADFYDADELTSYERLLRDLQSDVGGFETPLATDWQLDDEFGAISSRIGALRSERDSALSPYLEQISSVGSGLDAIDPWDEDALRAKQDTLADLMGDLSMFRGSDVGGYQRQIDQHLGVLDDRFNELGSKRSDLNTEAQDFLNETKNSSYYGLDDINSRRDEMAEMRDMLEKWGVREGYDEMDAIAAYLKEQEARLAADQEAVEQRENKTSSFARAMLGGAGMGDLMSRRTLSDDQLLTLMQSYNQQDDDTRRLVASSFSRSLGV